MTVIDVVSRMGQIQATLQQLSDIQSGRAAAAASVAPTAAAATSTAFADALATAQGSVQAVAGSAGIGSASAVTAANPNGATGADVVADAKKYLGVPYVWGGTDPSGFDCSGLVQHVFKDLGVAVPRLVRDQMNAGQTIPSLDAAKPGDLLVMNGVEHIGIYVGNNKYLHAPEPGQKVQISDIPAGFQFDRIVRVVPSAADPSLAAGEVNSQLAGILGASALGGSGTSASDLIAAARASMFTGSGS